MPSQPGTAGLTPAEAADPPQGPGGAAGPPAANRFAAPRRTGVRARYVDTMNSGGGAAGAGGGASVGLASLVPKPSFAPPSGEPCPKP